MSAPSAASEPRGARAVERTVDLLDCFATGGPELSLAELARATGLPKSTTHRITEALVRGGLLEREERTQRYRVGVRVAALGHRAVAGMGLADVVPQLYGVAARLGLAVTVALGPADALEVVLVAEPPGEAGREGRTGVGERSRTIAMRQVAAMMPGTSDAASARADGGAALAVAVHLPGPDGRRGAVGAVAVHGGDDRLAGDELARIVAVLRQVAVAVAGAIRPRGSGSGSTRWDRGLPTLP